MSGQTTSSVWRAGGATPLTMTLSDFAEPSIGPHANLYRGGTLPILKAFAEQTGSPL